MTSRSVQARTDKSSHRARSSTRRAAWCRRYQHSADRGDDGAGRRRGPSANQEPAVSGIDPHLPGPRRRCGRPVALRARRAAAVGHQYREERYLERKFGGGYRAYKERVRRWIWVGRGPGHMVRDYRYAVSHHDRQEVAHSSSPTKSVYYIATSEVARCRTSISPRS
jgi:hypothetical protein